MFSFKLLIDCFLFLGIKSGFENAQEIIGVEIFFFHHRETLYQIISINIA
jgi:hypothetical protein